ncbi:MAG: hypothetical protein JWN04_2242 [Myxococcaceae bacterium]|nr:hypothetical protein [Myxococcaceae bacterium]
MDVGRAAKTLELERLRTEAAQRASGAVGATGSSADTSVAISRPADLLKRLSTLKQSDPERFKLLMEQMSANLKAAANPQSGSVGAQLSKLSAGLARAGHTGDLSSLQPSLAAPTAAPLGSSAQRALAAYRRNLPAPAEPSDTIKQAMDYVLSVVSADP